MALKLVGLNPDRPQPGEKRPPRQHRLSVFKARVHGRKSPKRRRHSAPASPKFRIGGAAKSPRRRGGRKKHCRLRPLMTMPGKRNRTNGCNCTMVMWILTGVVIVIITTLLIAFRRKLFSSAQATDPDWKDIKILDPAAVAKKIQADNERRERIENEKFLAAQKAKKQWRMSLNNGALQPNHLGLPPNPKFRGIVSRAENYYRSSVKPSAQLKRDNEKLWAVCIIIYTDVNHVGQGWYADMNTSLREGNTEFHGYRDHLNDALNYLIIKDKERGKGPPATLYRGVGFFASQASIAQQIKQSNCDTFANSKQFQSTSENLSVARQFASRCMNGGGRKKYQFHCVLQGVTKAASIVDYGIKCETEWLIPTNSSFTAKVSGPLTNCKVIMAQKKWEDKKRRRLCERLDRETTAERYYHESESTHVEY